MTSRRTTSPSCSHGRRCAAPRARMAASPGLRMGTPASTPKTPTLVRVIVPPRRSAAVQRADRARSVRSASAPVNSRRVRSCASLMLGTTRPRGPATAMPRCTYRFVTTSADASSHEVFSAGWSPRARTTARAATASSVTWSPSNRGFCRRRSTSCSVDVTSTVRKTQACGAVATLRHGLRHVLLDARNG